MAYNCPEGQRWDVWKGMCVPQTGLPQTGPTAPTSPTNGTPPGGGIQRGSPDDPLERHGGGERRDGIGDGGERGGRIGGHMNCPDGYRWSPREAGCVEADPGLDQNCPEGEHWEGSRFRGGCVPDDERAHPDDEQAKADCEAAGGAWSYSTYNPETDRNGICDYTNAPGGYDPKDRKAHEDCINDGFAGYDPVTKRCTPKQCPQGTRYDEVTQECIQMCPDGYHWDAIRASCMPGEEQPGMEPPDSQLPGDWWDRDIGEREEPTDAGDIFGSKYPVLDKILGGDAAGEGEAEEQYWQTKMARLDEQYDKRQEQLEADLNVKGLYYSGARADKLQELNREFMQDVMEEEAKFQYERFERDMQRQKQALDGILGMESLNVQFSLGQGELTMEQLSLALQEKLGMGAQDIAQQGIDVEVMNLLTEQAMAQAATDIERQKIWANVVGLMYEMGLSEADIQSMWASLSGGTTGPPY